MAIPEYCDPRARKHFSSGFVGKTHGENGTGYKISWASMSGASPTAVHILDKDRCYCAYCGQRAFPIQREDYSVYGFCCVCKEAMDEVEWRNEYETLLKAQHAAREELKRKAPKPNKEALHSVVQRRFKQIESDIERDFFYEHAVKQLSITLGHPEDYIKE